MCLGDVGDVLSDPLSLISWPVKTFESGLGILTGSNMMGDLNQANQTSYNAYLNTLNPPEDVKRSRFEQGKSEILNTAPLARRRLRDVLASRGIRGEGVTGPAAEQETSIQKSINDFYNQIFGTWNVPSQPGPADWSPSGTDLLGKQLGDLGSILLLNKLLPIFS